MNRIKELRLSKGMKQSDLARLLKCAPTAVSKYELGQLDISSATILRLCDIFECTADYLLARSDNPSPVVSDEDAALLAAFHAAPLSVTAAITTLLQPYTEEKQNEADQAI